MKLIYVKNNSVVFLILLFGLLACRENDDAVLYRDSLEPAYSDSISILTLGDSYTIGTSVLKEERWPDQLADTLAQYRIPVREVHVIAKGGWTSGSLLSAIKNTTITDIYDLVGVLIGVNDQFQRRSISDYENNLQELFDNALNFADNNVNRVFFLSIPDYTVTPVGKTIGGSRAAEEINTFNKSNREIAANRNIKYFDITPLSRRAAFQDDLVAQDGLHFSGKMYALWVDYIRSDIIKILENDNEN